MYFHTKLACYWFFCSKCGISALWWLIIFISFFHTATWCGPCKMIAPKLEEFANTYADKLVIVKVMTQPNLKFHFISRTFHFLTSGRCRRMRRTGCQVQHLIDAHFRVHQERPAGGQLFGSQCWEVGEVHHPTFIVNFTITEHTTDETKLKSFEWPSSTIFLNFFDFQFKRRIFLKKVEIVNKSQNELTFSESLTK